jgi:hypothetical protein
VNHQIKTLRCFCKLVSIGSSGQGLGLPDNQPTGSQSLSSLHVICQDLILSIDTRLIITMNLLLYIPRVLFLNATTVPLTRL